MTRAKSSASFSSKPGLPEPKPYRGRYAAHKYWSKKPHEAIAALIDRHSHPGEIVADPFCGSGVTVTEAVRLGRRAVGLDINPIAIRQTLAGLTHVGIAALKKGFERIRLAVEDDIRPLYSIPCPACNNEAALMTHTIWRDSRAIESRVDCDVCKTRSITAFPKTAVFEIDEAVGPKGFLQANSRLNIDSVRPVSELFTPRNRYSLWRIRQAIADIDDNSLRETFELCFTAALSQASRLVFVIRNRRRKPHQAQVGSWTSGFWLPDESFEIYPWRCFTTRFRRMITAKTDLLDQMPPLRPAESFDRLRQSVGSHWVSIGDAATLTDIDDHSIDYILTDPPHGNRIPYLELSQLWNDWLGLEPDWEKEIVISEAKTRQKTPSDYKDRLCCALSHLYRILKVGKKASIIFNAQDWPTWKILLEGLGSAGFMIESVDKIPYSSPSLAQGTRPNALTCDLVITCLAHFSPRSDKRKAAKIPLLLTWLDEILNLSGLKTHGMIQSVISRAESAQRLIDPSEFVEAIDRFAQWRKSGWRRKTRGKN